MQTDIIIIGGGVAGLMAAKQLSDTYKVTLLEAQDELGGRIKTITSGGFSRYIEAGAEFIHGKLPLTFDLVQQAGLLYTSVAGKMYRKVNSKLVTEEEMFEGWDELLEKMASIEDDLTLNNFLQQEFNDQKYDNLRRQVTAFAEGFDVADPAKVSAKALYREWSAEESHNYRITGGYKQLVDYLAAVCRQKGCELLTGQQVNKIEWQSGSVNVFTAHEMYKAGKLLITIPISLLQEEKNPSITFFPGLNEYRKAAVNIGMGGVIKVVLEFTEKLWPGDTGFLLSEEKVPTWWTQLPDDNNIMTGWIGGPKVGLLSELTDEEIIDEALRSLASILDKPVSLLQSKLSSSVVFNWQENRYAAGAYTFETPNSSKSRLVLTTPVEETIWFAGEALYEGAHPGTVEAALVSGKQMANKILAQGRII